MATGCGTARGMEAADMRTGARAPLAVPVSARLGRWVNVGCETPQTFYSSGHLPGGHPMCCPNADRPSVGVCPGGTPCPVGGLCPTGESCVALGDPSSALPNIVVIY